jgi:hypothetical protein
VLRRHDFSKINNIRNLSNASVIVTDTAMCLEAELTSYMIHLVDVTEKAYMGLEVVTCASEHFTSQ